MRNLIASIAVLLSVCANAQYKETLHAVISPTNKVVTSIPDWAKSNTPPQSGLSSNEVVEIINSSVDNNYSSLSNKPSINGVVLDGNKTFDDLGLDLSGFATMTDLEGFATEAELLAFYYPDGNVTSMSQITTRGIEYAIGNDGGAYVRDGDGLAGHVVIPWKVTISGTEYMVTAIGESAFDADYHDNYITSFTAPITVKRLDNYAFFFHRSLKTINLPSVISIGSGAFSECASLEAINLPSVKSIGGDEFIIYGAFENCTSLTTVYLPSATNIAKESFAYCNALISISLPSATSIEVKVFDSCSSLTYVDIPSVAIIRNNAFYDCTSLATIKLPSVINIGEASFEGCTSLSTVDFGSSPRASVPSLPNTLDSFLGVPVTCRFIIPLGMYDEWVNAYGWYDLYASDYKFEGYASIDDVKAQTPTQLSNGSEIRTADALFRSMDNQNVLWTYVYGESTWIAVTNYMRAVAGLSPSFQLWEVRDGNTNCVYWSAEEIDVRVGDKIDIAVSNVVHTIATQKADRAWAKYQSMTGADNPQPDDITIVSTPSVMLSGGYEWQRFVDTGNEVWILKCNCPTMLGSSSVSNGVDTGNGYFKITDAEGNTHFSVEKTHSKLVDAVPNSVSFSNDGNGYFQVSFQSNVKPSLYVSTDLNTPFIECKEDAENDYGLTCSWSESDGIYTATVMHNIAEGKPSKLFAYGKVMQEGFVVIKNTAATSFDGGIIIGGNRYTIGTAVIDGKTVLTLENGQAVSE